GRGDHRASAGELVGPVDPLGALAGALGAVEPHRRLLHAIGADRTIAPLAHDAGTPVAVAVAGLHGGAHGHPRITARDPTGARSGSSGQGGTYATPRAAPRRARASGTSARLDGGPSASNSSSWARSRS